MNNALAQDLDHILAYTEHLWADARGERFFITGGTGFVGKWIMESFLWANKRLTLHASASVLTRSAQSFRRQCPHITSDPAVRLCCGDVTSFEYPEGTFRFVVHAATERYFPAAPARPASTFDGDIAATRRVLEFSRAHGARKLLFTSSGKVYGNQPPEMTHVPEAYPGAPLTTDADSAYGQGKRVSEFLCANYSRVYGFDAIIARLFAFIGPYLPLDANYAAGNFLRDVLSGEPIRISGDGRPYRSYLYAADLMIWLWTMLFRGRPAFPYNVGSESEITIAELAQRIAAEARPGTPIRIARAPVGGTPAERYVPSTERAQRDLGLRQWISLEEGIRRTYEWHAQKRSAEEACA